VQLKLGAFDRAIADYSAALAQKPKDADSLYGRGVAKLKLGDTAGGNADIVAAKALEADIAETYIGYGIAQARVAPAPATAAAAAADCARAETHWKTAEELRTLAVYEDHLRRFPTCEFADLARARIEALQK
jgi:tetratricopeptide (TPR) repeat protein